MHERAVKLFMNGRSQALRIPREFGFQQKIIYLHKEGDRLIVSPKPSTWKDFFQSKSHATDDYMATRPQLNIAPKELF